MKFAKVDGLGNDFVLIDRRHERDCAIHAAWVQRICERRRGVGADGVIVIENSDVASCRMRYFNADGSESSMCGNAARASGFFLSRDGGRDYSLETGDGIYHLQVHSERVTLHMHRPRAVQAISIDGLTGIEAIVGVPHVALVVSHLESFPVLEKGRLIRHSPRFPQGTNVNFIERRNESSIAVRTYERGVEDETWACGTGATTSAFLASSQWSMPSPIDVHMHGGVLRVSFDQSWDHVMLSGSASIVFEGEWPEEW